MANLLHYTVNTGNMFDCSKNFKDTMIIRSLRTSIQEFVINGAGTVPLPPPLEVYRAKTTVIDGAALFDLVDPEGLVLTVNAVAWTLEGQSEVWENFESFYIKIARDLEMLRACRYPSVPKRLPWLSTLIIPNLRIFDLPWVADFEQCYARALIPEQKRKEGGKGFK